MEHVMATSAAKQSSESTLSEGDKAPDFHLKTDGGGDISLSKLKGKNIVLYFYPKDDTPGCTCEAKDFTASYKDFEKANTVILGVSKDDPASHDKFKEKYSLVFPLGSDTTGEVCEAYGVWKEKSMYGRKYMGIERTTFLIGPDSKILKIYPKVKVTGHVTEIMSDLKEMKTRL